MLSSCASGARLHSNMYVPGGLRTNITAVHITNIVHNIPGLVGRIELLHVIALQHRLWLFRLVNNGVCGCCMSTSLSGVMMRSSGLA